MNSEAAVKKEHHVNLSCSFCGKSQREVRKLIAHMRERPELYRKSLLYFLRPHHALLGRRTPSTPHSGIS